MVRDLDLLGLMQGRQALDAIRWRVVSVQNPDTDTAFGRPQTASDGIHEMVVTDNSMRMPLPWPDDRSAAAPRPGEPVRRPRRDRSSRRGARLTAG